MNRRKVLSRIAAAVGAVGIFAASFPFFRSLGPSERARALGGPVVIDLSDFREGEVRNFIWRGTPISVLRRSRAQLDELSLTDGEVLKNSDGPADQPDYAFSQHRSILPEFLVVVSSCTHLGCVPNLDTETGKRLIGPWWTSGFHCPCHDSMYDLAGRVVRGPTPHNLTVPQYRIDGKDRLILGEGRVDV